MGALLPCPICNEQPKRNGRGKTGGVLCAGPGQGVGKLHRLQTYGADQAEADAAWNTRMTPPQDSVSDVERLIEVEAIDLIVDLCGHGASQSGTNCRVVEDHLRQFYRRLSALAVPINKIGEDVK